MVANVTQIKSGITINVGKSPKKVMFRFLVHAVGK